VPFRIIDVPTEGKKKIPSHKLLFRYGEGVLVVIMNLTISGVQSS
jgi:hypothetical protein